MRLARDPSPRTRFTPAWERGQAYARARLEASGYCTRGWVVAGADYACGVVRGLVENAFTYGVRPDLVRLWQNVPGRPELDAYRRAYYYCNLFNTDDEKGQGLDFYLLNVDDPASPLAIDWAGLLRERSRKSHRMVRGRVDRLWLDNVGFTTTGVWSRFTE